MIHPLSLVTKKGSSFVDESGLVVKGSLVVRGRDSIGYTR